KEYPDIEAGLSLIGMLSPEEVTDLLRARVSALEAEVERRRGELAQVTDLGLPEVFSVESDYRVAMLAAELAWVRTLVERLERDEVGGQAMWQEMHRRRLAGADPEEIEAAVREALPAPFRGGTVERGGDAPTCPRDPVPLARATARMRQPPGARPPSRPLRNPASQRSGQRHATRRPWAPRGDSDLSGEPMTAPSAIEVQALVKTYAVRGRPPVRALDSVSFDAPSGAVLGLLGPNGAGKSTTLKILTTLTRPDAGSARVAGVDVVARPAEVRRRIGYVAQRPV